MREQDIQRNILKYLKSQDCYVVKVVQASVAGVPDIIGCHKGHFFVIEVKTPTTKTRVSALQQHNLDGVRKAGGSSLVAWDVEQVKEFINELGLPRASDTNS